MDVRGERVKRTRSRFHFDPANVCVAEVGTVVVVSLGSAVSLKRAIRSGTLIRVWWLRCLYVFGLH